MEAIQSVHLLPGLSSVEAAECVCGLADAVFRFQCNLSGNLKGNLLGKLVWKHKC
jgi:hypothetical protein